MGVCFYKSWHILRVNPGRFSWGTRACPELLLAAVHPRYIDTRVPSRGSRGAITFYADKRSAAGGYDFRFIKKSLGS